MRRGLACGAVLAAPLLLGGCLSTVKSVLAPSQVAAAKTPMEKFDDVCAKIGTAHTTFRLAYALGQVSDATALQESRAYYVGMAVCSESVDPGDKKSVARAAARAAKAGADLYLISLAAEKEK